MLSYSGLVATRAVVLSTGEVLATGHGSHRVGRHPRPRKALLWTRHLPRIGPMASEVDLVARRPRFPAPASFPPPAMAAPPRPLPTPAACAPLPSSI
jgi:hypothetical protein